jgi:toxin-antitoxin system PIN domain toxin
MKKDSSNLVLLDVNVLLALAWPNHQFHAAAVRTIETKRSRWATCALTQLGFIRLSSNPSVIPGAKSPAECAALLEAMVSDPLHVYFDRLPSVTGSTMNRGLLGHNQVTDAYLLHLAHGHDAVFMTFDKRLLSLAAAGQRVEVLS